MDARRLRELPRKAELSGTTGPVPLTMRQSCTHKLGMKCVQAQAYLCLFDNFPVRAVSNQKIVATGALPRILHVWGRHRTLLI